MARDIFVNVVIKLIKPIQSYWWRRPRTKVVKNSWELIPKYGVPLWPAIKPLKSYNIKIEKSMSFKLYILYKIYIGTITLVQCTATLTSVTTDKQSSCND